LSRSLLDFIPFLADPPAMSTNKIALPPPTPAPSSSAPPPAPAKTSPVRLIVLLGILAVAIGALAYDYKVAGPACEAAEKQIETFVDERNKKGVKEGSLVTAEDIRKEINKQPTKVENNDKYKYTVEYYSWWGVPVLNLRRHYIAVVYTGDEPRHFSSYHRNSPPPSEALPIPEEQGKEGGQPLPSPESSSGEPAAAEGATAEPAAAPVEGQPAEGGEKKEAAPPAEEKSSEDKAPEEKTPEDKAPDNKAPDNKA
jgi:hypothetical protein